MTEVSPKEHSELSPEEQEARLKAMGVDLDDGFKIELRSAPTDDHPHVRWTIQVCLGRDSVILREPARGKIQIDTGRRESGGRRSIGTSDPTTAISRAKDIILSWRTGAPTQEGSDAADGGHLTVGDVGRLLDRTPLTNKVTYKKYCRAAKVARLIWGASRELNTLGEREIENAMIRRIEGLPEINLGKVCAHTARKTFTDYYTCIAHVCDLRDANNRKIWPQHPWAGVAIPTEVTVKRDGESVKVQAKPKKRFPYPPALIRALLHSPGNGIPAPVDLVDPSGQLRLIIVLAVFTGRRIESILALRLCDVGRTPSEVYRILNEGDLIDPVHAHVFLHGVLRFPPEKDKESLSQPIPIGEIIAIEIDRYLLKHEGTSPHLFPRPTDSSQSASYQTFFKVPWTDPKTGRLKGSRFSRALSIVEKQIRERGEDPRRVVPGRFGDGIHRFRSTWCGIMDRLWYSSGKPDRRGSVQQHLDYIAGWKTFLADPQSTRQTHYLELDPNWLQGIADWRPGSEVMLQSQAAEEERVKDLKAGISDSRDLGVPPSVGERQEARSRRKGASVRSQSRTKSKPGIEGPD